MEANYLEKYNCKVVSFSGWQSFLQMSVISGNVLYSRKDKVFLVCMCKREPKSSSTSILYKANHQSVYCGMKSQVSICFSVSYLLFFYLCPFLPQVYLSLSVLHFIASNLAVVIYLCCLWAGQRSC